MSNIDIQQSISRLRPNSGFSVAGNDYNRVYWYPNNTETQPTLAECEAAWQEIIAEAPMKKLREERNIKLYQCDIYVLPDWPHASDAVRQEWYTYREALRDLPDNSTPSFDENGQLTGVTWPTPPS